MQEHGFSEIALQTIPDYFYCGVLIFEDAAIPFLPYVPKSYSRDDIPEAIENRATVGIFWPLSDGVNDIIVYFASSLASEAYLVPDLDGQRAGI
jgi:hypothetical protein